MRLALLGRFGFVRRVDREWIKRAIAAAEQKTSGEIVVSVSRFFWGRLDRAAERAFQRLGMSGTRERNGVLLFIVPSRRQFVILGDQGIHERVGQGFWDETAAAIAAGFRAGDLTGAIVDGVERIGAQLAAHFPPAGATDVNELSDEPDLAER